MATKKDLVEAYSFSRRRLVTAFVSGAPGGREVEPSRPGRTIVGGVALAVLLVAGAAVIGFLKPPTTIDWSSEGLVSEKESGADYLVLRTGVDDETELRPLANITSAMLIFGADVESTRVPRKDIAEQPQGAPIGILEAPATPPEVVDLVQSGWSACTGLAGTTPVGIRLALLQEPQVTPRPDTSVVVRTSSGRLYLVAGSPAGSDRGVERAYAYPVPESPVTDRVLANVAGTRSEDAVPVPDQWVTLFPSGAPLGLATFGLSKGDLARPWGQASQVPGAQDAELGDVLEVGDGTYYLAVPGAALPLDEFSYAVYTALAFPRKDPLAEIPLVQGPTGLVDLDAASWPTVVRRNPYPSGQPCALTETLPDAQPVVVLASAVAGSPAYAEAVVPGDVDITVDSGGGAFVLSGDWDLGGPSSPVLVDPRGFAFPVGGGDERDNLGYGEVPDVVVPDDWVELLDDGVPLTVDAARCPPTSDPRAQCTG